MISHEFLVAETLNSFAVGDVLRLVSELRTNTDYVPLSAANKLCSLALLYTANDDVKHELLVAADMQYRRSYDEERGICGTPKKVCKCSGRRSGRRKH